VLWPRVREDHDLVLVARGPFREARSPEVTEEIEHLLTQADLIRR
jgi:RNase P protein component